MSTFSAVNRTNLAHPSCTCLQRHELPQFGWTPITTTTLKRHGERRGAPHETTQLLPRMVLGRGDNRVARFPRCFTRISSGREANDKAQGEDSRNHQGSGQQSCTSSPQPEPTTPSTKATAKRAQSHSMLACECNRSKIIIARPALERFR